jgi:hypothetical protein
MTHLLEQAYQRTIQLSDADQDAIAALILEEIEDEARWTRSFSRSAEALSRLAEEALVEHRAGRAPLLDLNKI